MSLSLRGTMSKEERIPRMDTSIVQEIIDMCIHCLSFLWSKNERKKSNLKKKIYFFCLFLLFTDNQLNPINVFILNIKVCIRHSLILKLPRFRSSCFGENRLRARMLFPCFFILFSVISNLVNIQILQRLIVIQTTFCFIHS